MAHIWYEGISHQYASAVSRSSAKVKVKYKGYISQKNGHFWGIRVSQTHLVDPSS